MIIPRRIIAAFAGVFLAGALAGGLVVRTFFGDGLSTFLSHAENPEKLTTHINGKLAHDYGLTAEEQSRIAPIVHEMTLQYYRQRREFGVNIMNTMDEYHGKIKAAMDPDHQEAYAKTMQERRQRMASLLLLDQNPPSAAQ